MDGMKKVKPYLNFMVVYFMDVKDAIQKKHSMF